MAHKNRYTGVLKPLPLGKGSRKYRFVLIYDIENDRLRARGRRRLPRLRSGANPVQRVLRKAEPKPAARIGVARAERTPRRERSGADHSGLRAGLKDMWVLEQYRRDVDE